MDSQTQSPSKQPKRFFDIVPANKTVPDTSSRPIIVTNQPEQVDPMVNIPVSPAAANVPHSPTPIEATPTIAEEPTPSPTPEAPVASATPVPEPTKPEPVLPQPDTPALADVSASSDDHVDIHDMPLELPADTPTDVVVVHHGYSVSNIRNIITVLLIIVMLLVITDLVLDIGIIKFALPHTHFFGS